MLHLSIISPVYGAATLLPELVREITRHVEPLSADYEILLVEDHSPDNSWEVIREICAVDPHVRGIKLSRNFGQHYAITAGLDHARGKWIVVLDCDLQDRPDQIPALYKKALEGYHVVQGRRANRKDSLFKRWFSWIFYKILAYLSGYSQDSTIANFGIYDRRVIDAIVGMREKIRFFPTMVAWVGFKRTTIDIEHSARPVGRSSYNFNKLFNLALDIVLAYSDKPLRLITKLGFFTSCFSFLILAYNFYKFLAGEIIVLGYASIIVSLWFLSGLIMLILGVVGLYVGKTFESTKNRPIYIVEQEING